ncbi:hypothetical protein VYU27_001364 [Nannochloropsis oceanica]
MSSSLGDAHFFEESMNATKVRAYLASNKEAEKSKGMKFLLANMSKGRDMSEFFPDVVKNVVARAVEVKKMVYMYLVHYADATPTCRELALLSINSFQKDLAAANQLIRALALRVMTSIRVPDIIQIQLLAVFKCASDSSPYVRRCAATAVPKIYVVDDSQLPALIQALDKLLKDSSTMVLGAAVAALNEVCPTNYELLHRCYRKLCHLLADMDEWTQISVLAVLTRYVRTQFCDPAPHARAVVLAQAQQRASSSASGAAAVAAAVAGGAAGGAAATTGKAPAKIRRRVVKKAFYSDEEDMSEEEDVEVYEPHHQQQQQQQRQQFMMLNMPTCPVGSQPPPRYHSVDAELDAADLDPDHRLLLRSSLPLLKSRNCGVVLAVATLHYYCGTQSDFTAAQLGKSLVRILRNRREIAFVVLKAIASMAQERPAMFRPFLQDFFVKPATDPSFCRTLKLDILTALTDAGTVSLVLKELQSYVKHADKDFVCATVRAVGRVADAQPEVAAKCLNGLMSLLACIRSEKVAGQAVIVVRQLLQQNKKGAHIEEEEQARVVRQLAHVLLKEKGKQVPPPARASLVWIVGEFLRFVGPAAPDLLRLLAQSFPEEEPQVKMQIVNLALKLQLYLSREKKRKRTEGRGGLQEVEEEEEEENAVTKLVRYVLEVARFDTNYDLRDRTRLLTASLGLAAGGTGGAGGADIAALVALRAKAEEVFLQTKLPPLTSVGPVAMEGMPHLTISSLSWMLNHKVQGYEELPDWVSLAPDPSVRDAPNGPAVEEQQSVEVLRGDGGKRGRAMEDVGSEGSEFYSDGMGLSEEEEWSGSSYSSSGGSRSGSSYSSSSDEDEEKEEAERRRRAIPLSSAVVPSVTRGVSLSSSDEQGEEDQSSSQGSSANGYSSGSEIDEREEEEEDEDEEEEEENAGNDLDESRREGYDELGFGVLSGGGGDGRDVRVGSAEDSKVARPMQQGSAESSLLDLEAYATAKKVSSPNAHAHNSRKGTSQAHEQILSLMQGMGAASISTSTSRSSTRVLSVSRKLLRHEVGGGLAVDFCFTREDAPASSACTLLLSLSNKREGPMRRIKVSTAAASDFSRLTPFPEVPVLDVGATVEVRVSVQVGGEGAGESIKLQFATDRGGPYPVTVVLPPEELLRPHSVSQAEAEEIQRSLTGGFHEGKASFPLPPALRADTGGVPNKVLQAANLAWVSSPAEWQEEGRAIFAALLHRKKSGGRVGESERIVVQVSIEEGGEMLTLKVNCDDAMMSATLLNVLKQGLASLQAPQTL